MLNLLAQTSGTLGYGVKEIAAIDLNWIGQLIRILIEGIGIVGVGIIVFTLILKTIVLPLDIYSRIKTKKQSLIMEKMRPQMEKLQKQYANDKQMYNQKVMELQKKSGYSVFGACLPMLVSLVIFIIVFNAFSTYSQYANLNTYNNMVKVYNGVVSTYVYDEEKDDGFLFEVKDENGNVVDYKVDCTLFADSYNAEKKAANSAYVELSEDDVFTTLAKEYKEELGSYAASFDISLVNEKDGSGNYTSTAESLRITLVNHYLETPAALQVKEYYLEHNDSFLWVRNLWYPDSMLNRELPDFDKFKSTITKANIGDDYRESYDKVTAALGEQKEAYNGYFVLIVLSIGFMLLQQWISMRANKAVNDLSTVDGSGAKTTKTMMIMMPIIYGLFSFFYSASFSVYMITNTIYSIITTLLINKLVDISFKKHEARAEMAGFNRTTKNRK